MAAIVDRFQKSAFGGAVGQPLDPKLPHRQIAHIGVDLDARDQAALKAEFLCNGVVVDPEVLVREMVEDSPSTVAHSVHKRILHKDGLLFVVRVGAKEAKEVSPELRSRASIVI